jgi:glycine C-acetyltransferase/8-amino-7-oxononanoate synthase
VAGARAALELLRDEPERVARLERNARALRRALATAGLRPPEGESPIVPVIVGEAGAALETSERVLEQGVFAQAIRPPTVPEGTSRLRLAVMACHTESELRDAARIVARAMPETGSPSTSSPARRELAPAA